MLDPSGQLDLIVQVLTILSVIVGVLAVVALSLMFALIMHDTPRKSRRARPAVLHRPRQAPQPLRSFRPRALVR